MLGYRHSDPLSRMFRFGTVLGIFVVLTMPAKSQAQCKDSDFPEQGKLTAVPTRPTESFPADPIQAGVLQYESGWTHNWNSGASSQTALPSMIRFGAWCNLELRWSANTFLSNSDPSATVSGFGDNFLGGQYRFVRESTHVPSMALGYSVKFPTADSAVGLGSAKTDHMISLLASKTIRGFSLSVNACYFSIGQPQGGNNAKGEWALVVSHSLKGKLSAEAEVYHDSRLNSANVSFTNSTWALTYNLSPRVVIDSGAYVGLTSGPGAPGRSMFVGLTYAMGSFYRPRRNRAAINE